MRINVLSPVVVLALTSALPQQSVSPDPPHETIEFENAKVRVLRVRIAPKDKSELHPHPDRVVIPLTNQRSRATTSTGSVDERDRKPGQVFWGSANIHMTENLSDQPSESLIIEIK